jgi:hypothetical protein
MGFVQKFKATLLKQTFFYEIYSKFFRNAVSKRLKFDLEFSQIQLQRQNIQNLKTILNREDLLGSLPVNKVVAEIGVDKGEFSELILKITTPEKLYLIDAWEGGRYSSNLKGIVEDKFKDEIAKGLVQVNVGYSIQVLSTFPDFYFDWVYLDTDHSYEVTKNELAILKTKVKPQGIIAGHDYISYDWVGNHKYGVIEAVNEFCVNENWEIIYLTAETNQYRSYAIRKIKN